MMDDRGVSPVVGTMLLVAVTVVAAGVIAYFVMGLGTPTTAPSANLSAEDYAAGSDNILVSHTGGDDLKADETLFAAKVGRDSAISDGDFDTIPSTVIGDYFKSGESFIENSDGPNWTDSYVHVIIKDEPSGTILLDTNVWVK